MRATDMTTRPHLGRLAIILAAAGLVLSSQQLLAVPLPQQPQPQPPLPTTTTTTTQRPATTVRQQASAPANNKLQIENEGLIPADSSWVKLNIGEVYDEVICPIDRAVEIKPDYRNNGYVESLAKEIRANVTVGGWYKDDKLLHRENGNPLLMFLPFEPNSLHIIQVTSSDSGTYNCTLNYSNVTRYHDEARKYLNLYPSVEIEVLVEDSKSSHPDLPPHITHPPENKEEPPGSNVTFTCEHIDTYLGQRVDWFRSYCSASNETCKHDFIEMYEKARTHKDYKLMEPYFIPDEDGDELTIRDVQENEADTYGCVVSNKEGIDIRIAELTLREAHPNTLAATSAPNSYARGSWILVSIISSLTVVLIFLMVSSYMLCFTKYGMKLCKNSPLLASIVVEECPKENSGRQHLPKVLSPDIYNIGKSDDGCIYGHFHQNSGHLLAQSMCSPNLIMEKNISISSNNYHSNDETSSWGKSLSSATTVPLYDHPITQLVHGSCVINPTYGFPGPDFSRRNLEPQKMIGQGQFGEVWRYIARQKDGSASFVAVKKLNVQSGQEQQAKDEILKEIEIMKRVNEHPNVIKFLNTCVEPTKVLLIMEYAENGTLQSYLRKCRYTKDVVGGDSVTSKELVKYSYHVAEGMNYIASKGIVHRDLATRNVLLSKNNVCKIADFGLARWVGDHGIYQRLDRNQPVPIKWMAPESLSENGTYTTKSDVFSAGILMWEVVTLGATPYDLLPSNEVLRKVMSGERLSRPEHCREEFYDIMYQCWHHDPEKRPTFRKLADDLDVLVQSENDYIQLDKYPEHAYYNINKNAEKEMVI